MEHGVTETYTLNNGEQFSPDSLKINIDEELGK